MAAENEDSKLAGVINFTGEITDEYTDEIIEFGEKLDLQHVALTTTSDGPKFKVNEDADVTVMHYKGKRVGYNYSTKGQLSDKAIEEIVKGASTILD